MGPIMAAVPVEPPTRRVPRVTAADAPRSRPVAHGRRRRACRPPSSARPAPRWRCDGPGRRLDRDSLAVTLLALFLRLWELGKPQAFEFDETYYAKDAWSLSHYGYVRGVRRRTPTTRSSTADDRPVDRRPVDGRCTPRSASG